MGSDDNEEPTFHRHIANLGLVCCLSRQHLLWSSNNKPKLYVKSTAYIRLFAQTLMCWASSMQKKVLYLNIRQLFVYARQ